VTTAKRKAEPETAAETGPDAGKWLIKLHGKTLERWASPQIARRRWRNLLSSNAGSREVKLFRPDGTDDDGL